MKKKISIIKQLSIGLNRSNYGIATDGRIYRITKMAWFNPYYWIEASTRKGIEVLTELEEFEALMIAD